MIFLKPMINVMVDKLGPRIIDHTAFGECIVDGWIGFYRYFSEVEMERIYLDIAQQMADEVDREIVELIIRNYNARI